MSLPGKLFTTIPASEVSIVYFANDRTIVMTDSAEKMRRFIIAGETGAEKANWADDWMKVADSHAAMMMNIERLRSGINADLKRGPAGAMMAPLAPLWNLGVHAIWSAEANEGLHLQASIVCDNEKGAAQVEETLKAMIVLSRNTLSSLRTQMSRQSNEEAVMALRAADMAEEVLDELTIESNDSTVTVNANMGEEAGEIIAMLVPAVTAARTAAKRAQSSNNMKQIGLAMHNYADVYGHFPPAVLMGPDGKTPHSWRVAILPFVEQAPLYEAYRQNEPWDSDHNKKILEQIPPVFRSPMDAESSTNSAYFALVGKGTVFESKEGNRFRDITDGTSNTLMVVETKKDIPWTKPEDIPIDLTKDLPEFGGFFTESNGFIGLICDGSVRFFSNNIDKKTLKLLIQRNDGNPIPQF